MKASSFLVSFTATLLLASPAFAGEFTEFGRVLFQGASTWVQANKVCQKNGMLFHRSKREVDVTYCDRGDLSNCVLVKRPLGPQPIRSTTEKCALTSGGEREKCVKWVTVPLVQGPVFEAKVYGSEKDLDERRQPKAIYEYEAPNCL
jgi:hypothetical protein